jgi:hypothetical protein
MKIFLSMLLMVTGTGLPFFANEECKALKNGKYQVEYTGSVLFPSYELSINGIYYTKKTKDGTEVKGKFDWLSGCVFTMKDDNVEVDSLSNFKEVIKSSFGDPCIELKGFEGNKIKFRTTYTGNLHITINEGVFIKSIDNK